MKVHRFIWKVEEYHHRKCNKYIVKEIQLNLAYKPIFYCNSGPASKIIVKFCIAVLCGIVGAIFTFPGLRMARMHWDSLKYCREKKLLQLLLNVSFVLPFILVVLWIKPVSREYLTNRVYSGMEKPM